MPRRSFAAISVPPLPEPAHRRLDPPPSLPPAQKKIWADVIVGAVPGQFRPADGLLLRHLCMATVKAEELAVALETETDPARTRTAARRARQGGDINGQHWRQAETMDCAQQGAEQATGIVADERARMQGII